MRLDGEFSSEYLLPADVPKEIRTVGVTYVFPERLRGETDDRGCRIEARNCHGHQQRAPGHEPRIDLAVWGKVKR